MTRRDVTANSRQRGAQAESDVAAYFLDQGYTLLARNYRVTDLGELDLVLQRDDLLTIVEVKARHSVRYGFPEEAVIRAKRRRLSETALHFAQQYGLLNKRIQFLAAAVQTDEAGKSRSIRVLPFDPKH